MSPIMMNHSYDEHLICVLLYGDYLSLAERCLSGLVANTDPAALKGRVRVGLNEVCEGTYRYVCNLASIHSWTVVRSSTNALKYPMMRELFFHTDQGLSDCRYVIWFDDDSYCSDPRWLPTTYHLLETADMVGALYEGNLKGNQHLWIKEQPWYNGRIVKADDAFPFAVGGWWGIRSSILTDFDWPPRVLQHRGGDIMLGQLFRQHGLRLAEHNEFVRINADDQGREEAAPRRGHDETAIGEVST